MAILDIDMDFFLNCRPHHPAAKGERLPSDEYYPWSPDKVRDFLKTRCKLNQRCGIPGLLFLRHDKVYYELRSKCCGSVKVYHVDAHADLGMPSICAPSYLCHVCTELLHDEPECQNSVFLGNVDEGSWLLYAVAQGWVNELVYVHHEAERGNDYPIQLDKWKREASPGQSCLLRLPRLTKEEYKNESWGVAPDYVVKIPFVVMPSNQFVAENDISETFITQSPEYTPQESDTLLSVFEEFIDIKDMRLSSS